MKLKNNRKIFWKNKEQNRDRGRNYYINISEGGNN